MIKKILNGFVSVLPFFYTNNYDIKHYPDDIYVNDWKNIGTILGNITRNKVKEAENDK